MNIFKEIRRTLKVHLAFEENNTLLIMAEAAFASMVLQLTNPFYQLFAKAMGADDVAIGLISSLPSFCSLFVLLPASLYIDRVPDKKKFLCTMITVCGLILPIVALSPFLGDRGYWFFIIGISLWNIPYICYTISWQSYFSDLFPPSKRALPYSRRMMMTNMIPAFTIMACGVIISYVCKTTADKIFSYQMFFTLAFVASIFQRWSIQKTQCPPPAAASAPVASGNFASVLFKDLLKAVKALKDNKRFLVFLVLLFIFYFSWQMAWPLFFLYLINHIGYNEFMKCALDVSGLLAFAITSTWWGRRIQKKGPGEPTLWGLLICATCPAWIAFGSNFWFILANYVISGMTAPGFQLGLFNDMLENLPEENKTLNIGIYNMVIQISNFVAPLVGVALSRSIGIVTTMNIASCARLFALALFAIRFFVLKKKPSPPAEQAAG